jgi:translation initiation factor 4B
MAANAKGKRRCKGKTIDLNTFLGEDQDAAPGFAVVQTRRIDWGDAMENEDLDDRFTLDYKKDDKVVLPTAPKAARGPDVDLSKVPTCPPYTAFLGNLPYDVSEDDIELFFRQLKVKNVRLPRENGDKGRIRGFGYAEFNNRQDLIQALALNNESLKNRAIKVSLAGEHDGDRDRRDGGVDRTLGDWRSDKRDPFPRDEPSRNDSYSSRSGFSDREPYRPRSNYDKDSFGYSKDRSDRNGSDRDFSFSRNDRDYGRDQDRFEKRGNERGYGFSSDRGMSRGGGSGGGRRDFRDSFNRRDEPRDNRYRDSERDYPPRDNYERRPPDRSDAGPTERRKLNLAPRTKPIEPVPPPSEAVSSSSIFGGAKPVDTAAREREIEERLAKEKETTVTKDSRERGDERLRKFSTGSGMSNRSRRSSDSGPPGSYKDDDEQQIPPYKPPIPRQVGEAPEQYNTLPKTRQRNSSNSSAGSDRENQVNSKANLPPSNRKENYSSNYYARSDTSDEAVPRSTSENSYPDSRGGGYRSSRNNSQRDNSRERAINATTYEEPKPPVYTSANKFSHLMADTEEFDRGSNSE